MSTENIKTETDSSPKHSTVDVGSLARGSASEIVGVNHRRTLTCDEVGQLERSLSERWEKDQHPPYFVNGGIGTLAHILKRQPTREEMVVAASVVQWLGTNCGRWFLRDAAQDAGWRFSCKPNNGDVPTPVERTRNPS